MMTIQTTQRINRVSGHVVPYEQISEMERHGWRLLGIVPLDHVWLIIFEKSVQGADVC